jgi:hypothetical protein
MATSLAPLRVKGPPLLAQDSLPDAEALGWQRYLPAATWAFVAIGVGLRLARYLLRFPLWGDEAMLADNFLDRGYADFLRPLDYKQLCPLGYLWAELAAVKLWGFHEMSLRLLATLCSVASMFLFRDLAARVLRGLPLLLAVGIFAVSYYPIRHGAEVKPYAGDLFASIVLMWLAARWLQSRERHGWLWGLAAAAPVCLLFSFPAVFVAGGISVALLPAVWRKGERPSWLAYSVLNLAVLVTFGGLYFAFLRQQMATGADIGRVHWSAAFPPMGEPLKLVTWLLSVHTSHMMAYPFGAERGGSSLTTLLCLIAGVTLWRQGRRDVLAICLLPLGVALVAAALRKYPYGASARTMQYAAPAICLMAGVGLASALGWLRRPPASRVGVVAAILLCVLGLASLARDMIRPYKTPYDQANREFARWFWPAQSHEAEILCATADLGLDLRVGCPWPPSPEYLCHQHMFRPKTAGTAPGAERAAKGPRSLRVVMHYCEGERLDEAAVGQWTQRFAAESGRDLQRVEEYRVNPGQGNLYERVYRVFEFAAASADARQ